MSSLAVQIVSKLVGQDNTITIPRAFVEALGSYETSAILSQLIYWYSKMGKEFYKTDEDFCQELCLTVYQLKKARKDLEGFGVNTKRKGVPAKLYYSLDLELLTNKLAEILLTGEAKTAELESKESANYIQETTTEDYLQKIKPLSLTTLDDNVLVPSDFNLLGPVLKRPVNKGTLENKLLEIWNQNCGILPKAKMNESRQKAFKALQKELKTETIEMFTKAVLEVADNPYWQQNKYGLDSLLRKGKVQANYEKYLTPKIATPKTKEDKQADLRERMRKTYGD